jgi:tetratricopeptide (TPR) repeat protein
VVGEWLPGDAGGGPAALAAGSRIAGYLLEAEIGAGGMAVVFRARDERLGRLVALKVLAPHLAANEDFRHRFLRESRAAAAVDDPHITPVYQASETDGVLFIAMRYVSGGDVRGLLRRQGPLPAGRAAAIISPVACALDAAHRAGLVHRDVKPGNMLIDARAGRPDHVYLSDFGIARAAAASVALTGTGFIGTAAYSAPEQIQGQVVDGRADQYALACVTYELFTGAVPFERDQDVAMLLAHLSAPTPSLTSRLPDLPGAVDQVLATAMAKAPGERYESCGAFADALREALGLAAYDRDPASVPARAAVAARQAPGGPDAADPGATVIGPGRARSGAAVPGRVPGGAAAATRTLPRDIASFTGRQHELAELVDAAAGAAGPGGMVGIAAIGGMAGVGKTALAVHAAHRLADRFPAGQIFLPLHGHTPGRRPVDPGDALASLLVTAGVTAAQIPDGTEARTALWRDRLAGRQLLLVLDDAASSEQVLPLLPGDGGSLVLVTSRRHLTALDDATAISLDTLPPGEAADLLVRLAARPGLGPDDPAVGEITRLCGSLPLAIGMVARQLHHHPAWTVAGRAADLAAAVDRLELMATENLSVAAAFDLSYADLPPGQQRLFRRLGLHPGPDIDAYAAAALDGDGLAAARRGLEALYDQYLLTEPAQGRYRLHDLLRAHARALAGTLDPDRDREQATARLLDYYQHTAALADALLARQARPAPAPPAGPIPAAVPAMADREKALAWARAERANLIACLDQATETGQHARIIALTAGLVALLGHDGPWAEALTRYAIALGAAQRLGDRPGQAGALTSLGSVRRLAGDYPAAARDLEEALGIYRDLGDRLSQASALSNLGYVRRMTGDYPAAARDLEEALGISRDLGDRIGQVNALAFLGDVRRVTGDYPAAVRDLEEALGISCDLGTRHGQANALALLGGVRRMTGDYPAAARDLEEALGLYRDIGNRGGEVEALNESGTLHRVRGDLRQAGSCHQQALDLARQIGSAWNEAHALAGLGRCALAADHIAEAEDMLRQALRIFQRIGAAEATDVARELGALTKAGPAG